MQNSKMKNRKYKEALYLCCLTVLLPLCGFTQPDIPMSTELKSNSDTWKIKVKQNGIWGKKPAQVGFGPLKTISTETESTDLNSSRTADRELHWKNIQTSTSRESTMKIELNDLDTIMIRMVTVKQEAIKEKNVVGTLAGVNGEGKESYQVSSWIDEMVLQLKNDSIVWHYRKIETGTTFGVLEEIQDTSVRVFLLKVNNLEGKKMKDIMFSQPALGFVFEYQGKQVAACQTLLKQMIWVSNTMDPDLKKAVLATAAAVMATIKSGDSNGY
jgi:hypothetical protein